MFFRRLLLFVLFAIACGFVSTANGQGCSGRHPRIQIGFSIGFEHVDHRKAQLCYGDAPQGPESRDAAITSSNDNIIVNYSSDIIRKKVKNELSAMAAQGASSIRTHLWYYHAEDEPMVRRVGVRGDPLGLVVASNGHLPNQIVHRLINFMSDAEESGYVRAVIVVGLQGSTSKCRKVQWGDCYNKDLNALSWSVVEQLKMSIDARRWPTMRIIFDISPEGCFDPDASVYVDSTVGDFTKYMLMQYRERFNDNRFIVSCAAGNARRAMPEIVATGNLMRDIGLTPDSVDIHVYDRSEENLAKLLFVSENVAQSLGVPLDINETYADHRALFQLLKKTTLPIRTLMIFPRRAESRCQIDVSAPYDIKTLQAEINGADTCR